MKMRFYIRMEKNCSSLGAVTEDGGIVIDKKAFHRVDVFLSVFLHELIHWFFDCFDFDIEATVHYWLDVVYARIGLFPYSVDRQNMLERVEKIYGRNENGME